MTEKARPRMPRKTGRRDAKDVFGKIVRTVSEGIRTASKGRGRKHVSLTDAVSGVVRGAVRASLAVGGSLVVGTKAIMMGVARSTNQTDEEALKTLAHTARVVLRETADSQGDLRAAGMGIVLGAVASARWMAVVPSRAAHAARDAVIAEAERMGFLTAEKVCGVLREDVGGTPVAAPGLITT